MTIVRKEDAKRRSSGRSWIWLSGGALAVNILMVLGLLVLLAVMGMGHFWPRTVQEYELANGKLVWGELHDREEVRDLSRRRPGRESIWRINVRVGNRELNRLLDFRWIPEDSIRAVRRPADLAMLERRAGGNFYGRLQALERGGRVVEGDAGELWRAFHAEVARKRLDYDEIASFESGELGRLTDEIAELDIRRRAAEYAGRDAVVAELSLQRADLVLRSEALSAEQRAMYDRLQDSSASFVTADGRVQRFPVSDVLYAIKPNELAWTEKLGIYIGRLWRFVIDDPRESNTEGGIFPAIFGTILMVFLMTFAVTPLGVLAALYLNEYARDGAFVRLLRIAVNNLAGVPSIVFGIFGLGFFVYLLGGSLDALFFSDRLPEPTFGTGGILWASLTLALLTLPVVIVATEEGLRAVPQRVREGSLALGATKSETVWRIVLPTAAPGILTGVILAISRAAGEVAPLMIVGMVKLADVPIDGEFPFLHLESKFMHLGFHIYDLGFQSRNIDATKPLVYATALLLVILVTVMNLVAIAARNHLRRKFTMDAH